MSISIIRITIIGGAGGARFGRADAGDCQRQLRARSPPAAPREPAARWPLTLRDGWAEGRRGGRGTEEWAGARGGGGTDAEAGKGVRERGRGVGRGKGSTGRRMRRELEGGK